MKLKLIFLLTMAAILTLITSSYSQGNTPPTGYLDVAKYEKGSFLASGWAADKEDGAPVSKVKVYIDKKLVGKATLGFNQTRCAGGHEESGLGKIGMAIWCKNFLEKGNPYLLRRGL